MNTKPIFHGSDLEKIAEYYGISQDSIVNFGANVNPLGFSPKVKEDISNHLEILSTYPDREYTALRQSISHYCQVPASTVLVGNGTTELISLLIEQRHPKKALILGPTYSEYARELAFSHCIQEYYHLNPNKNFILDLNAFLPYLKNDYDLLIICNPNNPTSSVIHTEDMRQILTHCKEQDIFVMIDETYVEFVSLLHEVTALSLIQDFDNFIILRGVSKFFAAPGLRLGYGITSNTSFLAQVKEHQIPWSLNSIGAFAGERLLQDIEYILTTYSLISNQRTDMLQALQSISGLTPFPAEANFILVHLNKPGLTAQHVFETCIQEGLMIRDCSSFQCLEGEYIRFCIMKPEDNIRLLHCLQSICS